MWRAFLEDRPDSLHPSPYWSRAEQTQYRDYLLGRDYLFQGFPKQFPSVTVLTITPAVPGAESLYVIKTLVGGAIGPITFVYPPWRRLDRGRARRSARFADSLAKAFGLPPKPLTYYVADTPEGMFRLQGLDFVPEPSQAGMSAGRADDVNGLVFSGSPVVQDGYRHEIAHVVLAPLRVSRRTPWLVVEGIATWTGGLQDRAFPALMRDFAFYLKNHWSYTLDSALTGPPAAGLDTRYATGAVLFQLAYERGGIPAIRSLFRVGERPSDIRLGFAKALGVAPDALDAAWRRKVLSYAR
jgi:hypothetical protein